MDTICNFQQKLDEFQTQSVKLYNITIILQYDTYFIL